MIMGDDMGVFSKDKQFIRAWRGQDSILGGWDGASDPVTLVWQKQWSRDRNRGMAKDVNKKWRWVNKNGDNLTGVWELNLTCITGVRKNYYILC